MNFDNFFKEKTVLVTGHTGFKGAWLSIWLKEMGAKVIGYSLEPPYNNSLFDNAKLKDKLIDIRSDVRDLKKLETIFKKYKPDIIFHLAAQPIVRLSYDIPRETFETNIMGTINVLECLRKYPYGSAVIITSDKCYENIEQTKGYVETDKFSNKDPYSSSKGCAELVVESYRDSFNMKVATARAGNVVGGGDWAKDRLVPDIVRALKLKKDIVIRNPGSVRPWQFVLESLYGYLLLAQKQFIGESVNEGWNFGPDRISMITVKELVELIIKEWGYGNIVIKKDNSKPEAGLLYLDCAKSKTRLGWKPKLDIRETINYIVEWYKNYENENVYDLCAKQIREYENLKND
jgi:CDP-glucose 4,6-dehydratase